MKNAIKAFAVFLFSFIIRILYYNLITYIEDQIPKSNIDGSICMFGIRLTSMQLSSFLFNTMFIIDIIVQIILAIVYKKKYNGSNKYISLKLLTISIISYIAFLIYIYISLIIDYGNTLENFH